MNTLITGSTAHVLSERSAQATSATGLPVRHIALQVSGACLLVLFAYLFLPFTLPVKGDDDEQYVILARDLRFGGGELYHSRPDASLHFPPGYPFLLSRFVGREGLGMAPFMQRVYYGLTVVIAAVWATLSFGTGVGWTVFVLVALNPALLGSSSMLASEGPHTVLYVAGFLTWLWFLRTSRVAVLGLCALSLALAAYMRGYGLLLVAFLPLLLMVTLRAEPWRRILGYMAVYLTVWAIVLAPWAVRNYRVWGHFVLLTTPGTTIYSSWFPPRPLTFGLMANDDVTQQANQITDHFEQDRFYLRATVNRILADPGRALITTMQKYVFFLVPFDWEFFGRINAKGRLRPSLHFVYLFILPFVLSHIWQNRRDQSFWCGPLAPVLYGLAMTALILGIPRFRLCIEPLLTAYAAVSLVRWIRVNPPMRRAVAMGYFLFCLVSAYAFMKLVE